MTDEDWRPFKSLKMKSKDKILEALEENNHPEENQFSIIFKGKQNLIPKTIPAATNELPLEVPMETDDIFDEGSDGDDDSNAINSSQSVLNTESEQNLQSDMSSLNSIHKSVKEENIKEVFETIKSLSEPTKLFVAEKLPEMLNIQQVEFLAVNSLDFESSILKNEKLYLLEYIVPETLLSSENASKFQQFGNLLQNESLSERLLKCMFKKAAQYPHELCLLALKSCPTKSRSELLDTFSLQNRDLRSAKYGNPLIALLKAFEDYTNVQQFQNSIGAPLLSLKDLTVLDKLIESTSVKEELVQQRLAVMFNEASDRLGKEVAFSRTLLSLVKSFPLAAAGASGMNQNAYSNFKSCVSKVNSFLKKSIERELEKRH